MTHDPVYNHDILLSNVLGGLFAGLPEKVDKSWILTDDVLKYLVEMYRKTGFRLGTIDVISLLLQF